jgi:hypothetical protein
MAEDEGRTERADRAVEELADDLEAKAERLEKHGDQLGDQIDEAREDWQRKQSEGDVVPADSPSGPEPPGDS